MKSAGTQKNTEGLVEMPKTKKASRTSMTLAGTRSRRAVPLSAKGATYRHVRETLRLRKLARAMNKLVGDYRRATDDAANRAKQQRERDMAFTAAIANLQRELSNLADNPAVNNANINELAASMARLPVAQRPPPVVRVLPAVAEEVNAASALAGNLERFSIGR